MKWEEKIKWEEKLNKQVKINQELREESKRYEEERKKQEEKIRAQEASIRNLSREGEELKLMVASQERADRAVTELQATNEELNFTIKRLLA